MGSLLLAEIPPILQRLQDSKHLVLALDFDGTLAPITDSPELSAIPPGTLTILRELSGSRHISIVVLSGRSLVDLRNRVDVGCVLAGNHGLEIEGDGISFVHHASKQIRPAISLACDDLRELLAGVSGVVIENKGLTATVHYRLAPAELRGWIEATVYLVLRAYTPWLALRPARKAWELCPRIEWNKGSALKFVLDHIRPADPLLISAGDDLTDEDIFVAFPDQVSIQVGDRRTTAARYHVNGPAALAIFLEELAAFDRSRQQPAVSRSETGALTFASGPLDVPIEPEDSSRTGIRDSMVFPTDKYC